MSHEDGRQLASLGTEELAILSVALADLAQRVPRGGVEEPMARKIAELREALSLEVRPTPAPWHVKVNEFEMLRVKSALASATSWRLYHRRDPDSMNRHRLVAQLEFDSGAKDVTYELARGLGDVDWLRQLGARDAEFVQEVEQRMASIAGRGTQIAHRLVEIPVPRDFMLDEELETRVEAYLAENGGPEIALQFVKVFNHSNDDLRRMNFGGFQCEIAGFEDEFVQLDEFLETHVAEIVATAGARP